MLKALRSFLKRLKKDQRGVTAIIGFVLVLVIIMLILGSLWVTLYPQVLSAKEESVYQSATEDLENIVKDVASGNLPPLFPEQVHVGTTFTFLFTVKHVTGTVFQATTPAVEVGVYNTTSLSWLNGTYPNGSLAVVFNFQRFPMLAIEYSGTFLFEQTVTHYYVMLSSSAVFSSQNNGTADITYVGFKEKNPGGSVTSDSAVVLRIWNDTRETLEANGTLVLVFVLQGPLSWQSFVQNYLSNELSQEGFKEVYKASLSTALKTLQPLQYTWIQSGGKTYFLISLEHVKICYASASVSFG